MPARQPPFGRCAEVRKRVAVAAVACCEAQKHANGAAGVGGSVRSRAVSADGG